VRQRRPEKSARFLLTKGIADLAGFDQEVAALYAEGHSVLAIAKGYGINDQPVRTSLYRSGVALRGKGGQASKIPPFGYDKRPRIRTAPPPAG
jgi:hypothetical protein